MSFYYSRTYVSYNEKGMHVWLPETGEQLFYVNFFNSAKCREVSFILYSKRFYVRKFKYAIYI